MYYEVHYFVCKFTFFFMSALAQAIVVLTTVMAGARASVLFTIYI